MEIFTKTKKEYMEEHKITDEQYRAEKEQSVLILKHTPQIESLLSLFPDLDTLLSIGVDKYKSQLNATIVRCEETLNDITHLRNIDRYEGILPMEEGLAREKEAYNLRRKCKDKLIFIETNYELIKSMLSCLRKVNVYVENGKNRKYRCRQLVQYNDKEE